MNADEFVGRVVTEGRVPPKHLRASHVEFDKRVNCRRCGKECVWGLTQRGNKAIFDPDTLVNHFATCEAAKQGVTNAITKFRDEMQRMVDAPNSDIAGIRISTGGRTVEVAKRANPESTK